MAAFSPGSKPHDYLLKFLLVGDSDVGKDEILDLISAGAQCSRDLLPDTHNLALFPEAVAQRTTFILLEGKQVKLQLWDTSGQGRFSTIIRSYSRGAQGVLVVYDITNRWSFDGIRRWLKEIDQAAALQQAPGIPKVLVGNRLHLEFRRQVARSAAEQFAALHGMEYFEVSTLAAFNVHESLTELSRLVLTRNGMQRLWGASRVASLQDACCRTVVQHLATTHDIDRLPLPAALRLQIKSFASGSQLTAANNCASLRRSQRRAAADLSPANGLRPLVRRLQGRAPSADAADPRRAATLPRARRSNRQCVLM